MRKPAEPWWRAAPVDCVNGVERWRIHFTTAASDLRAAHGALPILFTCAAMALLGAMVGSKATRGLLALRASTSAPATR